MINAEKPEANSLRTQNRPRSGRRRNPKCPLLLKADTKGWLESELFNSLSHKQTLQGYGREKIKFDADQ
jgi:hypothetical protein